jgi:hypothetical protein
VENCTDIVLVGLQLQLGNSRPHGM